MDFFIRMKDNYIGLQIKPASSVSHIPEIFKERNQQAVTHQKFTEQYGGKVFYVISMKEGNNKVIYNKEVVEEIQTEIRRLGG
ncbi:MAG: MjaI family restriction endonuclease [Bacteroidota bacterium]